MVPPRKCSHPGPKNILCIHSISARARDNGKQVQAHECTRRIETVFEIVFETVLQKVFETVFETVFEILGYPEISALHAHATQYMACIAIQCMPRHAI